MRTVCATGHRPEKVLDADAAYDAAKHALEFLGVQRAVTGMASGFDLIWGKAAVDLNIPLVCAIPWKGNVPRKADVDMWKYLLSRSEEVHYVNMSMTYPGPWVYQARNIWMVDNSDMVVAYWDGTDGGTKNCVQYADQKHRLIWHIVPITGEGDWLA